MNRYKLSSASVKKARNFLTGKSKTGPPWAVKYKSDLTVSGTKVLFKKLPIIPFEEVDNVLRTEIFKKNSDMPPSRDSAHHLCKQRYVGISRRHIMKFLMAQKPLASSDPRYHRQSERLECH